MPANSPKSSDSTREQLLDAAEALFLERGLGDVSLREIVREAGQKNQSALQYHFGSRDGLINAILSRRVGQLELRRRALVDDALSNNAEPGLRECCSLVVSAPFLLCRERGDFRDFLGLFGLHLLAANPGYARFVESQQAPSLSFLWANMQRHLTHLEPELLALRIDNAFATTLLAISGRARRGGSFRGHRAELFLNNLVDQVAAMLDAPASATTKALLDSKER